MNSEEFKCVFCKESFDDKEALQIHFRKHGDKNFHQNKDRLQDDPCVSSDKPVGTKEQAEMVECDVCPEVFTSISKAITHKHKVHPDHDAKYFCPWCGKLFTMKHLYNKHLSSSHPNDEKCDDQYFHCDCCNVDFNVPAAVSYHNKFFHRIYELPTIGNSKKLKMIGQEAVQIYYCPFCGEEYDNKMNLHKHMGDEHIDEIQNPDDVLRCPVCDAIFYHLDAYELHLTYHSANDMYSKKSGIMEEITDFSLETVPPIAEKVENLDAQADDDNVMGIEQLFELTMDGKKHKKKKHKKHKKSKKEAITMDQFLNMNKDVFGEGIDFQGVEEVPSQIVARRLKQPIKKSAQPTKLPPNIEQLKRQGIVIKKKVGTPFVKPLAGTTSMKSLMKVTQGMNKNANSVQLKSNTSATSNDVLAKLMNQNNSQIKIVKKSSVESIKKNEEQKHLSYESFSPVVDEILFEATKPGLSESSSPIPKDSNDAEIGNTYPNNTARKSPIPVNSGIKSNNEDSNHSQSILNENEDVGSPETESSEVTNVTDKINVLRNKTNIAMNSPTHDDLGVEKNIEKVDSQDKEGSDTDVDEENLEKDSLQALKKISHLVVKSVSEEDKPSTNEVENNLIKEKETVQADITKIAHLIKNKPKLNENNILAKDKEVGQNEVKKIAHLIRTKPTSDNVDSTQAEEKEVVSDVDKIGHLLRGKPSSNDHNILQTKDKVVPTNVNKIAHLIRNKPCELDNTVTKETELVHADVDKIVHLLRSKPTANEFDNKEKRACQTNVSKIAHLIRNSPAKVTTTEKPPNIIALPYKTDKIETEDNHFDTDDEVNGDEDEIKTEPSQTSKLASILNRPNLNVQSIKKTPIALPANEVPDEQLSKYEKSSANLLKHLKNVTAKPVGANKTLQMTTTSTPKSSPNLLNSIKKEPVTPPIRHNKVIQEDIEIFSIDDSDSDEATGNCEQNKPDKNETPNKSVEALKNINKNVTIKSVNNAKAINKGKSKVLTNTLLEGFESDCDDDADSDQNGIHTSFLDNNPKIKSSPVNQKQTALNNVLKNLSRNITVKSGNASPSQFTKPHDNNTTSNYEDAESETDSLPDRVKITEMDDASDDENKAQLSDSPPQGNVKVQYPDDSNSDHDDGNVEEFNEHCSDEDIETHINASTVKIDNNYSMSKSNTDNFKKLSKDMIIKPSSQANKPSTAHEIPAFAKSLSNQISIRNMKQSDNCNTQIKTNTANSRNMEQTGSRSMNKSSVNQKMSSNVVNKEVKTVKTFQTQTQTVIQEITTTVTKTIKTVNQSMKQEVRNTGQSTVKQIQQANVTNQNFQGMKVRQSSPMAGPRVRNTGIAQNRPTFAAPIRPSNQLVLARPKFNGPRPNVPRMSNMRPSTSGSQRPQIGTQIRMAPGVVPSGKRQNTEAPGHFSCFKKPKESLIPEVDFSTTNKGDGELSVQFSSEIQMSKSNFACTTKTVKGNSIVTSTQMKSEMSASSQQLNKLRNMSGLSVMKTNQTNQSQVEEKTEVSASQRNTLEAIQKLQSQGLLVKKPRLASEESEHSDPGSDHMEHCSDEELSS